MTKRTKKSLTECVTARDQVALHRRLCRVRRDLTRQQAAAKCGMAQGTFRAVEEARPGVTVGKVEAVAFGLDYPLAEYVAPPGLLVGNEPVRARPRGRRVAS